MTADEGIGFEGSAGGFTRAENLVSMLSERLAATAHVRNVYGEPIRLEDRVLVPVAKVGYGVGPRRAGAAERNRAVAQVVAASAPDLQATSRSRQKEAAMWRFLPAGSSRLPSCWV